MKLFEYLSNKKAIIASPIKSIKEVLSAEQYIKLPYKFSDFQEAADHIRSSNSEKLSYDYPRIVRKYTWENRAKNLFEFID